MQYFNLSAFSKINRSVQPALNYIIVNDSIIYTRNNTSAEMAINLPYNHNNITLSFSATEFLFPERIEYAYYLSSVNNTWQYTNSINRRISYSALLPGEYNFKLKTRVKGGSWNTIPLTLKIIIAPAWWQTTWFSIGCMVLAVIFVFLLARWRIKAVRKQEQEKVYHQQQKSIVEKEMLELEAKALRAQMNPHFIFNCMNSIKALIQQKEEDKAVTYLTTFSKLIRTIFQNSDKREITLYDEIETCRLYAMLESMRFTNKLKYRFDITETIDLKSVMVPPLILQPFIENAIWHGLMPREEGGLLCVRVYEEKNKISCIIEDDGVGRSISMQNKFDSTLSGHQSKGMHLTQSRLELNNVLNEHNATVEIIDKKDDAGKPAGTKVILVFNEE